jgi:uncharacterized membrane protein
VTVSASPSTRRLAWAGFLLGLGLAGFFDGILLHQILQWHHLLSALQDGPLGDLRGQVLADGIFHAVMYLIVAVGLWLLWMNRLAISGAGAGQWVFAHLLTGFGVWHVLDGIVVHWLMGLHRINPGSDIPLLWDLLFLGLGAVALAVGIFLRGKPDGGPSPGHIMAIAAVVIVAGGIAAVPWRGGSTVTVVFGPEVSARAVLTAVHAADARMVWTDTRGVWVLNIEKPASVWTLYRHGAWLVTGAYSATGCFAPKGIDSNYNQGII